MEWWSVGNPNTPILQYSNTPLPRLLFSSVQPAHVIFPAAHRKTLVGIIHFQLFGSQILGFSMEQGQMIPLAEHGEPSRALNDLFNAGADHRIAMSAHQNRRPVT